MSVGIDAALFGKQEFDHWTELRDTGGYHDVEHLRDAVDPIVAARVFLGMSTELGMSRMLYRGAAALGSVREVVEQMVDVFLKGISK